MSNPLQRAGRLIAAAAHEDDARAARLLAWAGDDLRAATLSGIERVTTLHGVSVYEWTVNGERRIEVGGNGVLLTAKDAIEVAALVLRVAKEGA